MKNIYHVTITRPCGSKGHMSAVGEGMTPEQAKAYVIGKQTWRVREAIAEGEYTVEVIGDVSNEYKGLLIRIRSDFNRTGYGVCYYIDKNRTVWVGDVYGTWEEAYKAVLEYQRYQEAKKND